MRELMMHESCEKCYDRKIENLGRKLPKNYIRTDKSPYFRLLHFKFYCKKNSEKRVTDL